MTAYTGVDNLEAMSHAANYNKYLTSLILEHARQGDRIVDFGAGTGMFAQRVKAAGYSVRCVEPDGSLGKRISESGLEVMPSLNTVADESVDYFYTCDVLEHIRDDVEALRELRAKLVKGGRLLVYVPACPILFSNMDKKVGHFRRYTISMLCAALSEAKLSMVHARYVDPLGFCASLLLRFIGSKSGNINPRIVLLYDRLLFPVSRFFNPACGQFFGKNICALAVRK